MPETEDPPPASGGAGGARAGTPPDARELRVLLEERWEQDVLPALAEYTRIGCLSPSFDAAWEEHGELERAAELLRSWCTSRAVPGATVELVRLDRRTPVLYAEIPATDPARSASTTLCYGHLDKQPPLGTWREGLDPYVAVREGDRLYGRGTADDGYSTFAVFAALEALAALGQEHGRCVMLIEASEESGSPDLEAYLDHLAPRIGTPGLVVCLDSGGATYDRLWLTSSLRGNLVATVRVDVLSEGVHSGMAGGIVPSSFRIARQLISRVEDQETGRILLPELDAEIPAHRRREIAEVAAELGEAAAGAFPAVPGLRLTGDSPAEQLENGTWRPALALTGVEGIPPLAEGGNVLRPYTSVKLSLRLPPSCDADEGARRARGRADAGPAVGRAGDVQRRAAGRRLGRPRTGAVAGLGGRRGVARLLRRPVPLARPRRLDPLHGLARPALPGRPVPRHRRARPRLERPRSERVPAPADRQGPDRLRRARPRRGSLTTGGHAAGAAPQNSLSKVTPPATPPPPATGGARCRGRGRFVSRANLLW